MSIPTAIDAQSVEEKVMLYLLSKPYFAHLYKMPKSITLYIHCILQKKTMLEHQVPTYSSDTFFHHTVLRTCKQNHLYRHCMSHRASMGCLNIGPSLCDRGHITQMFVNLQKARVFLLFIKQCKIKYFMKKRMCLSNHYHYILGY